MSESHKESINYLKSKPIKHISLSINIHTWLKRNFLIWNGNTFSKRQRPYNKTPTRLRSLLLSVIQGCSKDSSNITECSYCPWLFPLPEEGKPLLLTTLQTQDTVVAGLELTDCLLHDTSFRSARRHPVSFQRQPTVLPSFDAYGSQGPARLNNLKHVVVNSYVGSNQQFSKWTYVSLNKWESMPSSGNPANSPRLVKSRVLEENTQPLLYLASTILTTF